MMRGAVYPPISEFKTLDVELLGKPIHIIRDKLEQLISESCSTLTNELQRWVQKNNLDVELNSVSIKRLNYDEMNKEHISTFVHQSGGLVNIYFESSTLLRLADCFYDNNNERSSSHITSSDVRLQERIGLLILNWLAPQEMWQSGLYESAQELGIEITLSIRINHNKGLFKVALDSALIETLLEQLNLCAKSDLYNPFCRVLENTPLRLSVALTKKQMPLSDVIDLKPDDIIPIDLFSTVSAHIGHQSLFTGHVADQNGQLVLILNSDKES
ncbi:flagellar motor switch protein FliM [Vibrio sagamiensis NBRC 104589]|uniref:Flagellar motor switch protein FliM n=2 Tax=Vibrio sagamiensis TaxID=512650 RepID=A0A511QD05_9VIBR|nr:flagellar motor switch protein FliM [Vibrio sagamiensis NBRC 104589]